MMTAKWWLQQAAHFCQGLVYSWLLAWITSKPCWWVGLVIGCGVELYQYLGPDHHDPRLLDRACDLAFWLAGGLVSSLF